MSEDTGMMVSVDTGMMMMPTDSGMMMMPTDSGMMMMPADSGMMMMPVDSGMPMMPTDTGMMMMPMDSGMTMMPTDSGMMSNPDAMTMGPVDSGVVVDTGPAPCISPMLMCGTDCINPQTDSSHCGACDYSCGGGSCSGGTCNAFTYFTQSGSSDLDVLRVHTSALGTKSLVWTVDSTSGSIQMREASDSVSTPIAVASGVRRPEDVAVEQDRIWYSHTLDDTTKSGRVYYRPLPISLSNPSVDVTNGTTSRQVYSISVYNSTAYWYGVSGPGGINLRSYNAATTDFFTYVPQTQNSSYGYFIIATAGGVFWQTGTSGAVYMHTLDFSDGSSNSLVAQIGGHAEPRVLAESSTHFYWGEDVGSCHSSSSGCQIYRLNKSSGTAALFFTLPMGTGAYSLFFDGGGTGGGSEYLYYTSGTSNNTGGTVGRIAVQTMMSEVVQGISNTYKLRGIAKVDDFVFWVENRGSNANLIRGKRL